MRVLIGVDGSTYSDAALTEVAQRMWPKDSEFLVVHAFELPLVVTPEVWALPPNYYQELDRVSHERAETIKASAVARLKSALGDDVEVTGKSVLGSAKRVILDEAEDWKPDLIVVGSHGYSAWGRLLLGSVSQAVVSHAKCSVEVVRRKQTDQAAA